MLKNNTVEMVWTASTRKYYIALGYIFTNLGDSFKVKISDLPSGSHKNIDYVCDYCAKSFGRIHKRALESNSGYSIETDCCDMCFKYKNIDQKFSEYGLRNRETIVAYMVSNDIKILSGVYKIRNTLNGKIYIGSTKNILSRWNDHINELSMGSHKSHSLADDFHTSGIEIFEFSIIEFKVEKSELVNLEHTYIRDYRSDESEYGYNTVSLFKINKNKSTNNRILEESNIIEIKKMISNKEDYRSIAKSFGVTTSSISDIRNGLTWSHIKTIYDEDMSNSNNGKRTGESNGCSKLTESDVRIIKLKLKNGDQMTSIGIEFNVSRTLIRYIKIGKLWGHVS